MTGALRLPALAVRMLRWRVAVVMWLFMLLAAAFHGQPFRLEPRFGAAVLAMAAGYVAATTVNDLADEAIDRVNHPGDRERPLVSGAATRRDLWTVYAVAVVVGVVSAATLGWAALALVGAALVIGHSYSMGPARLSARTVLAPLVLGLAYVWLPYGLGLVVAGAAVGGRDLLFAGALFVLFVARIALKDFRDRDGDRHADRSTLVLRYGPQAVCGFSLGTLVAGTGTLLAAVDVPLAVTLLLVAFTLAIASRLPALWRAATRQDEQVAIGVAAKMSNGLLITLLGVLLLDAQGASAAEQTLLAAAVAAVYGASFAALLARPQQANVAYKG